jgi:hypothetical protein
MFAQLSGWIEIGLALNVIELGRTPKYEVQKAGSTDSPEMMKVACASAWDLSLVSGSGRVVMNVVIQYFSVERLKAAKHDNAVHRESHAQQPTPISSPSLPQIPLHQPRPESRPDR